MDASRRDPVALYQVTITNRPGPVQDDVAALLRRTADELDALGAVGVRDITFHVDESGDDPFPSMTVYYDLDDAPIVLVADTRDDERDDEDDPDDDVDAEYAIEDDVAAPDVVDVRAAEIEEDTRTTRARDGAPHEINPEWFMPPVLERLAAPAEHDDDVLPANGAPVQPVTSFPLRMPPTVDRSGISRLRGLLRSTSRRRTGVE
jgi:hypothetical protein